jgi:hypothetical protein
MRNVDFNLVRKLAARNQAIFDSLSDVQKEAYFSLSKEQQLTFWERHNPSETPIYKGQGLKKRNFSGPDPEWTVDA